MYPEVRVYPDPFDGLTVQLTELRGLIKVVPPLIEADRQRRWEEIGAWAGSPDDPDMIDIYEAEAGAEEGCGHAKFDRTIYVAAVITAWAVFQDFLARQLKENYLSYDLSEHPPLAALVEEEARSWDRRFEKIATRYREFAGIPLAQWPSWDRVRMRASCATLWCTTKVSTHRRTSRQSSPIGRLRTTFTASRRPPTMRG